MCTTTMQHRIESDSNFEASIKDDPYRLLKAIKKKMFDPAKSKYSFAVFTDQLERLLAIRQEDGESLTEYVKRFKQHRNNTKELIESTFLDKFIENTEEYQVSDKNGKKKLTDEGFASWTSFLLKEVWITQEKSPNAISAEKQPVPEEIIGSDGQFTGPRMGSCV